MFMTELGLANSASDTLILSGSAGGIFCRRQGMSPIGYDRVSTEDQNLGPAPAKVRSPAWPVGRG